MARDRHDRRDRRRPRPRGQGFTYLWLIFALAVAAAGLAAIAQPIRLAAQREREAELMARGNEIAHGLSSYWAATPGDAKQLPKSLDDLLDDTRGPHALRHLRRVYDDPFTGKPDWVLVLDENGRIAAVHSRSQAPALRTGDLAPPADGAPVPVSARVFSFAPPRRAASAPVDASSAAAGAAGDATRIGSPPPIAPPAP